MKISCPNCNDTFIPSCGTHTCKCKRFQVAFERDLEICYYFFFFSENVGSGIDVLASNSDKRHTFYNITGGGQDKINKFILPKEFTLKEFLKIRDKISKLSNFT